MGGCGVPYSYRPEILKRFEDSCLGAVGQAASCGLIGDSVTAFSIADLDMSPKRRDEGRRRVQSGTMNKACSRTLQGNIQTSHGCRPSLLWRPKRDGRRSWPSAEMT